jgi:DNA anti-recombination protein RmuC
MPDINVPTIDLNQAADDLVDAFKEATYIMVGLGVIGFQRAQVQRVERTKHLEAQLEQIKVLATTLGSALTSYLKSAREQVDAAGGQVPDQLQSLAQSLEKTLAPLRERIAHSAADLPGNLLEGSFGTTRAQLVELAKTVDEKVAPVRHQLDDQVDRLEQRLPGPARDVVQLFRASAAAPEQAWRAVVGLD